MAIPSPVPEVETRDVYLFFVCNTDRPAKQYGDILCVLDHPGTDDDRRVSCCLRVTGITEAGLQRLQEGTPEWWHRRYLWGYAKTPELAAVAIKAQWPALDKTLLAYMNQKEVQPKDKIPSVPWLDLREKVYDVVEMRLSDPETELEVKV